MATAADYKYGQRMIEEAKRLGLNLVAEVDSWELHEGAEIVLRSDETGAIHGYLNGYKEGIMERVESVGLTLDYRDGYWIIERDGESIYRLEPVMRYLDIYLAAYHSAQHNERKKLEDSRPKLFEGSAAELARTITPSIGKQNGEGY